MADLIFSPIRQSTVNASLTTNGIDLIPSHYPPPTSTDYPTHNAPQPPSDYPKYDAPSPPTHSFVSSSTPQPPPLHPRVARTLRPVSNDILNYRTDLESDIPKINECEHELNDVPPVLFPRCKETVRGGSANLMSFDSSQRATVLSLPVRIESDTDGKKDGGSSSRTRRREKNFVDIPLISQRTLSKSETQSGNQLLCHSTDRKSPPACVNNSPPACVNNSELSQPFNFLSVSKNPVSGKSSSSGSHVRSSKRPVRREDRIAENVPTRHNNAQPGNQSPGGHLLISSTIQPKLPSAVGQVVALDHWPLRTPTQTPKHHSLPLEPETHFSLDRVVPKRHSTCNEYVEEPSASTARINEIKPQVVGLGAARMSSCPVGQMRDGHLTLPPAEVVTTQPSSNSVRSSTKKKSSHPPDRNCATSVSRSDRCHEGLVCARCGRCHCAYCTGVDRPLPSCWMCRGRCECSARTTVDYCTCVWVARTIFYHSLYHEDDDVDIVAEPFACCEAPHCCLRWSIIGALLPCLPCLICYCPLSCAVHTCEACHSACVGRNGCHCRASEHGASSTSDATASTSSGTTRSLLNESESV